jgi:hypothetical protein
VKAEAFRKLFPSTSLTKTDLGTSCFPKTCSTVLEAIMDARVLDYIDDRLATSSDFEALDSLIENVKEQQDLLKRQVTNIRLRQSHT